MPATLKKSARPPTRPGGFGGPGDRGDRPRGGYGDRPRGDREVCFPTEDLLVCVCRTVSRVGRHVYLISSSRHAQGYRGGGGYGRGEKGEAPAGGYAPRFGGSEGGGFGGRGRGYSQQ